MATADESQNVVAVMSATTATTPGTRAAARSSPTWPALVMSISGGMVTIASSAGCCALPTGDPLQGGNPGRGPGACDGLTGLTPGRVTALLRVTSPGRPAARRIPRDGRAGTWSAPDYAEHNLGSVKLPR